MMLILEDPGGEPLDRLLGQPMELGRFLGFAVSLAAALGKLHQQGLIHKDIKPANILANSATGAIRLTGFGIASRLPRERQSPEPPPEVIAGTLAYMAPEQTGRMNRSIDSRSDLYSLGVTFYEMLTGALPFNASDPMEWVHCHIARQPVTPDQYAKEIPAPLSAIVLKLLAKTAEERYQTAAGVAGDLRRCLTEWEAHCRIDLFQLGACDVSDQLLIPEKLYGRKREIEALISSFDRVVADGTPELVLVSGYSGIGKSSVVQELHRALVPPRGLFGSGKFDQYKRDIPYEVGPAHPLLRTLESIREAGAQVQEIVLASLGLDDVGRLLADTLHCEPERVRPLLQLVQEKTGGNPFFAIQFFKALAEEGLLAFDPVARAWQWDIDRLRAKSYTDNVVDLMAGKLKRFSATTQEALKRFACLGNVAEVATLALVHGETEEVTHAALWEACSTERAVPPRAAVARSESSSARAFTVTARGIVSPSSCESAEYREGLESNLDLLFFLWTYRVP